jgi:hypothetical protein
VRIGDDYCHVVVVVVVVSLEEKPTIRKMRMLKTANMLPRLSGGVETDNNKKSIAMM